MEIAGYIASIFIGIALGLIGGGGSILTVPVLYYLFGLDSVTATGYSLFIVGITSAFSSASYLRRQLVDIKTAVIFGIPSIIAVFATRAWLVPALPSVFFSLGEFQFTKNLFMLTLFAILMIAASYSMIRKVRVKEDEIPQERHFNFPLIIIEGLVVGTLTGLVGAGGGFLIIPALVVLSKLPMKMAVGTSLVIIAAKSLIGFIGETHQGETNWNFLLLVSAFAIAGGFLGIALSKRVDGKKLKPAFGYFILVMGIYILVKELAFPGVK